MRTILNLLYYLLIILLKTEDLIKLSLSYIKSIPIALYKKIKNTEKKMQNLKSIFQTKNTLKTKRQNALMRNQSKNRSKRKKRLRSRIIPLKSKIKYLIFGIAISLIFFFVPILTLIFLQDFPTPNELTLRQTPQTTKIYDRNGILLTQIYASQNRTIIPLSDIPIHLRQATIAIEDKNFYNHPGFDITSILRALKVNLSGEGVQGGSTITQQLIKSSILTPEKSITRKIKELILAFWAERIYTKSQILEMYFNQVPYGGTAWGIEAASQTYFNKSTKSLDLAQSAFLAGLTSAPTTYSPYGNNPDLWKVRQKEVLSKMVSLGFISEKQASSAAEEKLNFQNQQIAIHAPHFVNYVKDYLTKKYGLPMLERGGLNIITSIDLNAQDIAEKIVKEEVEKDAYLNLSNGAALITNPSNGDILAMIGSKNWFDPNEGNFNLATSLRQPGSSIKVVTYAAALEEGQTAATIINDSPITYPNYASPYTPVNYDGRYHGNVTLRQALANSFNIPAVKTLNQIGVPTMVNLAKKMGITTWRNPEEYGLSITLGAAEVTMLDMATVYGTLANQGERVDLNPILRITDSRGITLEEKTKPQSQKILDPGVAFIISDILADNQSRSQAFGINSPLNIPGHTVSVKTGTSDNKRDNWTAGYTNNFVVITWVGNNNNAPMSPHLASGITGAAPIWNKIMTSLLMKYPETKPVPPPDIMSKICRGKIEYFIQGTENTTYCNTKYRPFISGTKKPLQNN